MAQPESTGKKVASSSSTQSHHGYAAIRGRSTGWWSSTTAKTRCSSAMLTWTTRGALTGRKYWKVRTAVFNGSFSYKKRLGRHTIPKARIEEVMREMCDSGQYHLTNNNCQKWAKELLHRLGVEVPLDEPDAQAVVDDVVQPVARFTLLMGALAVAKFILFRGRV
ncbi:hypothetical protein MTO96_017105 [Rhipicephalus appendiculatus]